MIFTGAAVLTKAREAIRRDIAALSVAFILFYSLPLLSELSVGAIWAVWQCLQSLGQSKI